MWFEIFVGRVLKNLADLVNFKNNFNKKQSQKTIDGKLILITCLI